MNEFLQMVKERHDRDLLEKPFFCPYCKSTNVEYQGTEETTVGYSSDVKPGSERDPNHFWDYLNCRDCNKKFRRERKRGIAWYTDHSLRILAGIPGCYEPYIYTCSHCGGDVIKTQIGPDGKKIFSIRIGEKQQFEFKCLLCGAKIISENEYFKLGNFQISGDTPSSEMDC